jgi:hypothetical protein
VQSKKGFPSEACVLYLDVCQERVWREARHNVRGENVETRCVP